MDLSAPIDEGKASRQDDLTEAHTDGSAYFLKDEFPLALGPSTL